MVLTYSHLVRSLELRLVLQVNKVVNLILVQSIQTLDKVSPIKAIRCALNVHFVARGWCLASWGHRKRLLSTFLGSSAAFHGHGYNLRNR